MVKSCETAEFFTMSFIEQRYKNKCISIKTVALFFFRRLSYIAQKKIVLKMRLKRYCFRIFILSNSDKCFVKQRQAIMFS